MLTFLLVFWRMNFNKALNITTKSQRMSSFSKTMTQNTRAKRPRSGSKRVDYNSWSGLLQIISVILGKEPIYNLFISILKV